MLKKRLNNKKGFTLAELLIAVAIIGILVAISVPVFTSKLGDARKATDQANIRAAKAAAVTKSLEGNISAKTTFYYDAAAGILIEQSTSPKIKGYGQSSTAIDGATGAPKGQILQVDIETDGTVTLSWTTATAS